MLLSVLWTSVIYALEQCTLYSGVVYTGVIMKVHVNQFPLDFIIHSIRSYSILYIQMPIG